MLLFCEQRLHFNKSSSQLICESRESAAHAFSFKFADFFWSFKWFFKTKKISQKIFSSFLSFLSSLFLWFFKKIMNFFSKKGRPVFDFLCILEIIFADWGTEATRFWSCRAKLPSTSMFQLNKNIARCSSLVFFIKNSIFRLFISKKGKISF